MADVKRELVDLSDEVVEALLAHGAYPTATDPQFRATPLQWAEFLHRPAVVARLTERGRQHDPVSGRAPDLPRGG